MKRVLGTVASLALLGAGGLAGDLPEGREILEGMKARYAELPAYTLTGRLVYAHPMFSALASFQVWFSYPSHRLELAFAEELRVGKLLEIGDLERGRRLLGGELYGPAWIEEEIEGPEGALPWAAQMRLSLALGMEVEVLEEAELGGRRAWRLRGRAADAEALGGELRVTCLVAEDSLFLLEVEIQAPGLFMRFELDEPEVGVKIPAELFLLPEGAQVVVRSPRSPEAEAFVRGLVEELAALPSFYLRKAVRSNGMEAEEAFWFQDPYVRQERMARVRVPGTDLHGIGSAVVSVYDLERGVLYMAFQGKWEGMEYSSFPAEARGLVALSLALGLDRGSRYIALEEGELEGRGVLVLTREEELPDPDGGLPRSRWWIDPETRQVLQFERVFTLSDGRGRRRTVAELSRVEEFRPGVEAPQDKFAVPEGVPVRRSADLAVREAPAPQEERLEGGLSWEPYAPERLRAALEAGKPVVLYFGADWCEPCRYLEEDWFRDPRVAELLGPIVRLKVDLSDWRNPAAREAERTYRASVLPTLVFLLPDGREAGRITGYSGRFLTELRAIVGGGR